MFFELIDFLGWRWLVFFHLVAFGLLYLPFIYEGAVRVVVPLRKIWAERQDNRRG
ncbi:hypothetical protein HMH01_02425 [Halovulum dunhuangense]|uniref:Uncharacterized protein n=1 Tax=Halovulum dunhuangense TaxID=1505036 RepID=A0A849KQD5_9RHOB|nr:hypothetical protein [Halovulum dunhuangense]NNU79283.1 hypothetical protein [Halovulum dunhuangense]